MSIQEKNLERITPVNKALDALSWEEEYAYSLGIQAYVYGFPWIYLSWLKWLWTTKGGKVLMDKQNKSLPWAPVNSFYRSAALASSDTPAGGSPNCDTLYAVAWLDVSKDPIVVSVPKITDRYYCMQLACLDSDNFDYIGGLNAKNVDSAANYLIAGPDWEGDVPDGVVMLEHSRTPDVLIFGRTGVNDTSDDELAKANKIQDQYTLTTLTQWNNPHVSHDLNASDEIAPHSIHNPTESALGAWVSMNRAMRNNPPGVSPGIDQLELLKLFATIGVGPNESWEQQSKATKKGLERAAKHGLEMLRKMASARGSVINNWNYPPQDIGRAGQNSDFITRASLQALAGISAHDAQQAVYINTALDAGNEKLAGGKKYIINFKDKKAFPPLDEGNHGFWSITMYQSENYNILPGSKAYSVNSYYPEFQSRDVNDGMTIYMQSDKPEGYGSDGEYWLEVPEEGSFYLILRVYVPDESVWETQTWNPPVIQPVK